MFVDFSMILYVSSDANARAFKLLTNFRAWCFRIWSWNLLLKLQLCLHCLQIRWTDVIFVEFDDFCEWDEHAIADLLVASHIDLTLLMRFKVSCSRMCSKNFSLKLKFCSQNLQIARAHVTFWIDAFFTLFDIVTNVFSERFKREIFNLVDK